MVSRRSLPLIQSLESRMFLSATPTTTTTPPKPPTNPIDTNPTIVADRKALAADQKTLFTDSMAGGKTLFADQQAINAELKKLKASDTNLATELKTVTD